ncbi:hypothetical protein FBU59_003694, partial [Linderina macrospora]
MQTSPVDWLNDRFVHSKAFRVYAFPTTSPADTGAKRTLVSTYSKTASPLGWTTGGETAGNNVKAQYNPEGLKNPQSLPKPTANSEDAFDCPIDLSHEPSSYANASTVQVFYAVNILHDVFYLYGFDEASGNFQDGLGNDPVIASVQDGSVTDNASFGTPPDGESPIMRMHVWTGRTPHRDAGLDFDIIAHEFTHGVSSRLTGGPKNTDCLQTDEARGLGEGWSDIVAVVLKQRESHTRSTDMVLGDYVDGKGIREFPYSTNMTTNPTSYAMLAVNGTSSVHTVGLVWATMLYEVLWNLIDALGFSADLFAHDLSKGNSLFLQLLVDSFKLQKCNPT